MKTFGVTFVEGGSEIKKKEVKVIKKAFRKEHVGNIKSMDIDESGGFITLYNYNEEQLLASEIEILGATMRFAALPLRDPKEKKDEGKVWTAPEDGWLKYNVDGSFREATKDGGIGGLLRNNKKEIIESFSEHTKAEDNNEMELLAVVRALESISEKYKDQKLIIETDCKNVSEWMTGKISPKKHFLPYYRALRLLKGLDKVYIQFRSREHNSDADALAEEGAKKEVE